jgi:hypothetical protein
MDMDQGFLFMVFSARDRLTSGPIFHTLESMVANAPVILELSALSAVCPPPGRGVELCTIIADA